MRLSKLSEFRRMVYTPKSAPTLQTLRTQIREGTLPGGMRQGKHYYVDLDEWDRVYDLSAKLKDEHERLKKSPRLKGLV